LSNKESVIPVVFEDQLSTVCLPLSGLFPFIAKEFNPNLSQIQ